MTKSFTPLWVLVQATLFWPAHINFLKISNLLESQPFIYYYILIYISLGCKISIFLTNVLVMHTFKLKFDDHILCRICRFCSRQQPCYNCQSWPHSYLGHLNPLKSVPSIEWRKIIKYLATSTPNMSRSYSNNSKASKGLPSQSTPGCNPIRAPARVNTTTQTVNDSSSRKGVKSKVVRLQKAEKMLVNIQFSWKN